MKAFLTILFEELREKLFNSKKFDTIMASIIELQAQVEQLQEAVDREQAQIERLLDSQTAAINELNETIEQLRQDVVDGGTAEQREELAAKLEAIRQDLEATVEEESTTTTTTEVPEEEFPNENA